MAVQVRGTPLSSSCRTSSARPRAIIWSTRPVDPVPQVSPLGKVQSNGHRLVPGRLALGLFVVLGDGPARLVPDLQRPDDPFLIGGGNALIGRRIHLAQLLRRGSIPSAAALAWSRCRQPVLWTAKVRPEIRESMYSPVPPTTMDRFPRAKMSSKHRAASATYRATDQLSSGSATPIIWWGTPSISSGVGLAVPMSIRR